MVNRFLYKVRLTKFIDFVDFTFFLPLLKYLPLRISELFAKYRGILRWLLDIDWRSISIGYPHIKRDTKSALSMLCDRQSDLGSRVRKRFIHQSLEEMESVFFAGKQNWPQAVEYDNLDALLAVKERGRGLVLLGAHYDSTIAGITFFGSRGFTVNIFFDEIVYDPRVPKYIQRFFRTKYENIRTYLNGGIFISKRNMKDVYRRLSRGETFIVVSDVMNSPEGIKVRFMNRDCIAPYGALRVALKTNSYLGAFVTLHEGKGVYRTICATPTLITEAVDPEETLRKCYAFLSDIMMKYPERWWACDKLLEFK